MFMREKMQHERNRLEKQVQALEREIAAAPEGTFYEVANGKYTKWCSFANGKTRVISKADRALAAQLAVKQFQVYRLTCFRQEMQAIEAYLDISSDVDEEEYLAEHPQIKEFVYERKMLTQQIREWAKAPYKKLSGNGKYQYQTLKGDLVKSQAEKDIADALYIRGIPYRYECELYLQNGGHVLYPDFTILDPSTGYIYIWEHFGMSEINRYQVKNADKLYQYFNNGYVPGLNLICTASDDRRRLSKSKIEEIIDQYFYTV